MDGDGGDRENRSCSEVRALGILVFFSHLLSTGILERYQESDRSLLERFGRQGWRHRWSTLESNLELYNTQDIAL